MANLCLNDGYLVGVAGVIPDDATVYAWPTSIVGCNALRCGQCHAVVRQTPGVAWSGKATPRVEDVTTATALVEVAGVEASATGRLYRCACTAHVEHAESSIAQHRETQRSSVGAKWQCVGHSAIELPADIAGVHVEASGNARAWVLAIATSPDFMDALTRLTTLYFRLRGSAVEPQLTMAIAALVSDDDARLRDLAMAFYARAPFALGAERVGIWAAEQPAFFTGKSHFQDRDRWTLALLVGAKAVAAGRPYEPPVQALLRREALTEAQAFNLYDFLAEHDREWFVANAHRFPASVAAKVSELMKFRATPEELAAYRAATSSVAT